MTRSIVAGIVALALVVTCGILEVVFLRNDYKTLHRQCQEILQLVKEQTLTVEQFNLFRNHWVELRETSELFLPHTDVYEINLRVAESQAYVEQGDYNQLWAQLSVVEELLRYVPHLLTPALNHIV